MALFYVFSSSAHDNLALLILGAFFHFLSIFFMVILAFADPGIIPKIYGEYELKELKRIPISQEYIDGSIGEM